MNTTSVTRSTPRLPSFHVAPPRKLQVELPAREFERLERYATFYNQSSGAAEDGASVAAAIIQHFIARDRNFGRWDGKQPASNFPVEQAAT